MTAFFGVHLVLTLVTLTMGTIIGGLGLRALRRASRKVTVAAPGEQSPAGTAC